MTRRKPSDGHNASVQKQDVGVFIRSQSWARSSDWARRDRGARAWRGQQQQPGPASRLVSCVTRPRVARRRNFCKLCCNGLELHLHADRAAAACLPSNEPPVGTPIMFATVGYFFGAAERACGAEGHSSARRCGEGALGSRRLRLLLNKYSSAPYFPSPLPSLSPISSHPRSAIAFISSASFGCSSYRTYYL